MSINGCQQVQILSNWCRQLIHVSDVWIIHPIYMTMFAAKISFWVKYPPRWVGGHSSRCNLQCWSVGSDGKDYLYGKPSQDHTHSHLQKIALFCSPVAECSWDQDWTDIWVRLVNERTYLAFNCNFFILQNNAKARFGCSMISSFPQVPIGIRTVVIC